MKVLFPVKKDFFLVRGGVFIQITKYAEKLIERGHEVLIWNKPLENFKDFSSIDIIHLNDLTWIHENIINVRFLKSSNIKCKIVLSTVFWPLDDYALNGAPIFQRLIARIGGVRLFEKLKYLFKGLLNLDKRFLLSVFIDFKKTQKEICDVVDLFLPNSEIEMIQLNNSLKTDYKNYKIIYNAIDYDKFPKLIDKHSTGVREGILFVGRIDSRKNQIGFLKAMKNCDHKITFIGSPGPNSKFYFNKLKKLAGKFNNVSFISHLPYEEVFVKMINSELHVLTSWVETPGLVSLEAGFAGCKLVVCDKGSVREYFQDYAHYCDPDNPNSIREAVEKALAKKNNYNLKDFIAKNYTWKIAVSELENAYENLLE